MELVATAQTSSLVELIEAKGKDRYTIDAFQRASILHILAFEGDTHIIESICRENASRLNHGNRGLLGFSIPRW